MRRFQLQQSARAFCSQAGHNNWKQFFQDPSKWWDNRSSKKDSDCPDFVHVFTGEKLWINSHSCPKWLRCKLDVFENAVSTCKKGNNFVPNKVKNNPSPLEDRQMKLRNYGSMSSWSKIIAEYTQKRQEALALDIFSRILAEGFTPDVQVYVAALKACISLATKDVGNESIAGKGFRLLGLEKGRMVHDQLIKSGWQCNRFIASTLLDLYVKCEVLAEAQEVFDGMVEHDLVTWGSIIMGYAQAGEGEVALRLFARMEEDGIVPDAQIFVAALKACSSLAAREEGKTVDGKVVKPVCLEKGRVIHSRLAMRGFESNIFVASSLIDFYSKCGNIAESRAVFDRMVRHDVIAWNGLLGGYAQSGDGLAMKIFERMPQRSVISWNSLIAGFTQSGDDNRALEIFQRMLEEGFLPDSRTYVAALKALAASRTRAKQPEKDVLLEKVRAIHSQVLERGLHVDMHLASTLVDAYAKCGSIGDAQAVFDGMTRRDAISWNAVISGYVENGKSEEALQLFQKMEEEEGIVPDNRTYAAVFNACSALGEAAAEGGGKSLWLEKGRAIHTRLGKAPHELDMFVANALLDMYGKCGSMDDAKLVFGRMQRHDVVSWNSMILGFVHNGCSKLALEWFELMQARGFQTDAGTFAAALKACGNMVALEAGKAIHARVLGSKTLSSETVVVNSLISFYGKCGVMDEAQKVFDQASTRKDVVTWSSLIAGYSLQGNSARVLDLLERMHEQKIEPNGITYLSILAACSHGGLVEQGKEIFEAMKKAGVRARVEHYSCMVDMLGRANYLDEAVAMAETMPLGASVSVWMAVLSAARNWGNVSVAKIAFEKLEKVERGDSAAYLLMANTYASAGGVSLPSSRPRKQDLFP